MKHRVWSDKAWGIYGLFALAWGVYVWGLAPTISWRDSPEFVTVVQTLGISHPAGSPTYALLAKLLTFLPIGSIALRVNLFSALCGALTIAGLFSLLYDLLEEAVSWVRFCASLSGALALLVAESFWRFAEVAEVYTLQDLMIVLLITLLVRARKMQRKAQLPAESFYWLCAFLYGISAGVHATMAFFAPAFLLFIGLTAPRMFRLKKLAFLVFFFFLGFLVYLYLPVRSLGEPVFDWGDPQTWRQFFIHITDRKDAATHFAFSWWKLPHQMRMYAANLSNEFSTLGLLLGVGGCLSLVARDPALALLLGLIFLGNVLFFIPSWTAAFGFLPSFVIFAVWIGCGVQAVFQGLAGLYHRYAPRIPQVVVSTIFLLALGVTPAQTFLRHVHAANQSGDYSATLYGQQLLEHLPPEAIVFSHYSWFPLTYLQLVERRRPDVTVMLQGEVFFPGHFAFPSRRRFPNIHLITSSSPVMVSTVDYFWMLSKLNAKDHPLFWDADEKYQQLLDDHLTPKGLLYSFDPFNSVKITKDMLKDHNKLLQKQIDHILNDNSDREAYAFLAMKINLIGIHFKLQGFDYEASEMYKYGLRIRHDDEDIQNNYGNLLISWGRLDKALEHLNIAYNQNPVNPIINKNIGRLLLRWGDYEQAARFFQRALVFGGDDGDVYAQLGEAYARLGRYREAIRVLQSALQLFTAPENQAEEDERLAGKITWVRKQLQRFEALADGNGARHRVDGKEADCVRGENDCRRGTGL